MFEMGSISTFRWTRQVGSQGTRADTMLQHMKELYICPTDRNPFISPLWRQK